MATCRLLVLTVFLFPVAAPADDTIMAGPPDALLVGYASNLYISDSFVNLTNAGSSSICANAYVFDSREELIYCCSCPIDPGSSKSYSVRNELRPIISLPLFVPESVVIKLLSTLKGSGDCNAAGFHPPGTTPGLGDLAPGLRASLIGPNTGAAFSPLSPSTSDVTKLTTDCGFMYTNGSGFGICRSCQPGAVAGRINVSTNLAASTFTLDGFATFTGSGTSYTQPNAPAGGYAITFGAVPGYLTPAPDSQYLTQGGNILFSGSYTPAPDMIVARTNSAGGPVKTTIANAGAAPAVFTSGQTLLIESLPTGASYDPPTVSRADVSCGISAGTLTCTANAATVTLDPGSSFDVSVTATPGTTGLSFTPQAEDICAVDPNNNVAESDESNNSCSDSVAAVMSIGMVAADAAQVIDPANLLLGDSVINFTNTGVRNGFDPDGGICANIYTFDPSEEMISCCACYVTPDGLKSVSVKEDLISNNLTPGSPSSVVIRVLATSPVTGATCNAASPSVNNLEGGLRAWGTNLHQNTASGRSQITEVPSLNTVLSIPNLRSLPPTAASLRPTAAGSAFADPAGWVD